MSEQKPRVWNVGDPEPVDVTKVRDSMGDVWTRERVLGGSDVWMAAETATMTWERIAKKYAPLTDPCAPCAAAGGCQREGAPDCICEPAPKAEAKLAKTQRLYDAAIRVMVAHLSCVKEISAERDQLQARIDKALALHRPDRGEQADPDGRCFECGETAPCPTARILRGEEEQPVPPVRECGHSGPCDCPPFGQEENDA